MYENYLIRKSLGVTGSLVISFTASSQESTTIYISREIFCFDQHFDFCHLKTCTGDTEQYFVSSFIMGG